MQDQSNSTDTERSEGLDCQAIRKKPKAKAVRPKSKSKGRGRDRSHQTKRKANASGSEATSESPESKRIQAAARLWQPAANSDCGTSDSDEEATPATCEARSQRALPSSSSLFDYAKFLLKHVLTEAEMQAAASKDGYRIAELGAGMATGTMCAEGIRRAFQEKGVELEAHFCFYTEVIPWKQEVISKVHSRIPTKTAGPGFMFSSTGELSAACPRSTDGVNVTPDQLECSIALLGIECDDISSLTLTPKSVLDPSGKSGSSFLEFTSFLERLPLASRPKALMIECVANLSNKRSALSGERGTKVVGEALSELGYIGSWSRLNAKQFYLPQSRPRAYGIFLKQTFGFGGQGKAHLEAQLKTVWDTIHRCKANPFTEPLSSLLERSSTKASQTPQPATSRTHVGGKWANRHQQFRAAKQLTDDDLAGPGLQCFQEQAQLLRLTQREKQASLYSLAAAQKTGKLPDWRSGLLVGNLGDSVDRLQFKRISPCVLPSQKYLWLNSGQLEIRRQSQPYLALQGIGPLEETTFGLDQLAASRAQDLAGNAFAANICCAVILSLLSHVDL